MWPVNYFVNFYGSQCEHETIYFCLCTSNQHVFCPLHIHLSEMQFVEVMATMVWLIKE